MTHENLTLAVSVVALVSNLAALWRGGVAWGQLTARVEDLEEHTAELRKTGGKPRCNDCPMLVNGGGDTP